MTVTNTGTAATRSWKVTWTWAGNQQITNSWNVTESHSGKNETATNAGYNGVIAPNGNTQFGFRFRVGHCSLLSWACSRRGRSAARHRPLCPCGR
ncbi:cellulose binding domain-containing protein [Kibdelosporangium lantanae]|uniref:Cellulose binding domain-containing protein n=1 Tax=Kibdelosporangium lantanae TaxID=1497396 RepID=A0ABW3MBE7_9PSEU